MQAPCCDAMYHTVCALHLIQQSIMFNTNPSCSCGTLLVEHAHHSPSETATNLDELRARPDVARQIKLIKKKMTEEKKALVVYNRYIREKEAEFKGAVQPHIESIKTIKKATLTEIKASEAHKAYKRLKMANSVLEGKLRKEHSLNWFNYRRLIGQSRYSPWRNSIYYILSRRFRVRL